jgi:hypothetical protein
MQKAEISQTQRTSALFSELIIPRETAAKKRLLLDRQFKPSVPNEKRYLNRYPFLKRRFAAVTTIAASLDLRSKLGL